MRRLALLAALAATAAAPAAAPAAGLRVLREEVIVPAPVSDVWTAWSTTEGIRTFFAPDGLVEPRVDGRYEIWFLPDAPKGQRGDEGTHVLQHEPEHRLAFTWTAPPSIPTVRAQKTIVTLDFEARDSGHTLVRLTHLGWGEGPEWDRAFDYFDRAWGRVVLPRLLHRFRVGPVDWSDPPPAVDAASIAVEVQGADR